MYKSLPFLFAIALAAFISCNPKGPANNDAHHNSDQSSTAQNHNNNAASPTKDPNAQTDQSSNRGGQRQITSTKDLRYHGKPVYITKHANCRMGCRHFNASEIQDILDKGQVNQRKSQPDQTPCPVYALEGYTHDNQRTRAVIADCDKEARLITIIDLDKEFKCTCD